MASLILRLIKIASLFMNIHEYQAKELLKKYGVRIQEGILAHTPDEAEAAAKAIKREYNSDWCVVKAQIHAG